MTGTIDRPDTAIDPITFEVIRHRLWTINDDQGRMAARLSGSATVYELNDFNAALLTPDGRGLFIGAYMMGHASTLETFVCQILERWAPEDIHEGDVFFASDPWSGTLHANDGAVAVPLFAEGTLVGWSSVVMHDTDVGSPIPSSMVVGATDRFGEAPLFPPIKLGEDFTPRPDLLAVLLRNSRTAEENEQNMRARMAALRVTNSRIAGLVAEYGIATFLAAQEEILAYVERVLRERIRELPDGTWSAQTYHDHDSLTDQVFTLCVRLTKRGDHLTFDTAGTSPQAPGPINCTRPCLVGSVVGALLVSLCYDMPWATGALRPVFDLVAEDATINTAVGSAPVSMGSMMAVLSTNDLMIAVMSRMLLSSPELRHEAQATWAGGFSGAALAFPTAAGQLSITLALDALGGGGGARSGADGLDSGGLHESPATRISNVEVMESRGPLLQLYRRERPDSGGAGRYRGGAGLEYAIMPHKAGGPGGVATMSSGVALPLGLGLAGGDPNGAAANRILGGSDVAARFAAGRVPAAPEELTAGDLRVQGAKDRSFALPGDVFVQSTAGGSGFGDPLRRDPEAVLVDVRHGLVSEWSARHRYGVVLGDGRVDVDATGQARTAIVRERLGGEGTPDVLDGVVLHPVSDAVEAVEAAGRRSLRCTECHHRYCGYGEEYKRVARHRDVPLTEVNPLNARCREDYVLREFFCPGCGTTVAADITHIDEPVRDECRFVDEVPA